MKKLFGILIFGLLSTASSYAAIITINASSTGFYSQTGFHDGTSREYTTGLAGSTQMRGYFAFDLSTLTGTINSVTLTVYSGAFASPSASETLELFDVTTGYSALIATANSVPTFIDLGSGNSYGSQIFNSANSNSWVTIAIGATGIANAQSAIGSTFAIGGGVQTLSGSSDQYVLGYGGLPNVPYLTFDVTSGPDPEPTPEVGTMMAIGSGLASLAAVVRRRRAAIQV